ncbi:unnamed protein product [Gadus morhua 'NCC']
MAIMGFLERHVKERVTSSNMDSEQGDYSQDSQEIAPEILALLAPMMSPQREPLTVRCGHRHLSSISSHYLYGGSGHTAASCTSTTTEETAGAAAVCVPEIHHDLYTKGKGECTGC